MYELIAATSQAMARTKPKEARAGRFTKSLVFPVPAAPVTTAISALNQGEQALRFPVTAFKSAVSTASPADAALTRPASPFLCPETRHSHVLKLDTWRRTRSDLELYHSRSFYVPVLSPGLLRGCSRAP